MFNPQLTEFRTAHILAGSQRETTRANLATLAGNSTLLSIQGDPPLSQRATLHSSSKRKNTTINASKGDGSPRQTALRTEYWEKLTKQKTNYHITYNDTTHDAKSMSTTALAYKLDITKRLPESIRFLCYVAPSIAFPRAQPPALRPSHEMNEPEAAAVTGACPQNFMPISGCIDQSKHRKIHGTNGHAVYLILRTIKRCTLVRPLTSLGKMNRRAPCFATPEAEAEELKI